MSSLETIKAVNFPEIPDFEVLISETELQKKIKELAGEIEREYQDKELMMIAILKGSFMFLSDLCRHIHLPLDIDFLGLSSYGSRSKSSGVVQITLDLNHPIEDKDVLIVEDIVDTGLTINYLLDNLKTRKPRSIKICSLLEKPSRCITPTQIDFLGFTIPDLFVIGYGLDLEQKYRNIPYIGYIKEMSPR